MSPNASGTDRLPLLDGIRALAIVLVLAAHSTASGLHQGLPVVLGMCGVSIFFVLSGYLITRSMLLAERRHGRLRLGNFYFRRSLRIFPAFYAFLIVLTILENTGVSPKANQTTWGASVFYFRNLAGSGWETGHLWSLALEEQFYLFWPMLFILTKRHRLACIGIAVLLFIAWRTVWVFPEPADMSPIYMRPDLRLDTFLIGGAFAIADWTWVKSAPAHLVTALLLLWYPLSLNTHALRSLETPVAAFAMATLIVWLVKNPGSKAARMLSGRAPVLIGTWSYSIYLWQQIFLGPHSRWWSFPALALASMGSWYLIERPCLALRDRGLKPSAEPIGSAMLAPRRDPRNTVSRAQPYPRGTP
jgi:peptidoglycan/LPS O-acetylase OafA/YrhL